MKNTGMIKHLLLSRRGRRGRPGEEGFVLVFALVILVVVSLLGIWALNSSTIENLIAGNEQAYEQKFNIAEGGIYAEAAKIGHNTVPWYIITDPNQLNQILVPTPGSSQYDPGLSIPNGGMPATFVEIQPGDAARWPRENLINNYLPGVQEADYAYLVTYLYPDIPPKGYSASDFSGYKFQINSHNDIDIEAGGKKIGAKSSL
jgi:hypothetical protein